ncbi:unnamed protein product [Cuscuta epithymum]|uniref:Uncharacterized protein n=1 Tax=Cuscuta epithymum TaxID=186058 RepID=A0AAV0CZL0_9ASTE|nr:unnamed protein product [Cuscuta epithymum]
MMIGKIRHSVVCGSMIDLDWVAMDRVCPGVRWVGVRGKGAEGSPNRAVALEAGAEGDLPDAVSSGHAALGLGVGQLVPQGAAGGVAEAVQGHAGRLHVPVGEVQVVLQRVQHRPPPRVDAEVVERPLEVGDVGLHLRPPHHDPPPHQRGQELELLREREHEGPQGGDVGLQRVPRHRHQLPRQRHPHRPLLVLPLVHAPVAAVVRPLVGAHRVHQLVLGPPPVPPPVRQQHRRAAHPEDAVAQQHGAVVAEVPVQGDVLRAHHHRVRVRVRLQQMLRQVHRYEPRRAPHSAQVVAAHALPQLVVVHYHRRQRRRRVEQAAVHYQDPDLLRLHSRRLEQRVQRPEHHRLRLRPRLLHRQVRRRGRDARRHVRLVAQPRPPGYPLLERHDVFRKRPVLLCHLQEPLHRHLSLLPRRFVAREVHQVHRPGPLRPVQAHSHHQHRQPRHPRRRVYQHTGVPSRVLHHLPEPIQPQPRRGQPHQHHPKEYRHRHSRSLHRRGVLARIPVPQLHIFQLHGLEEVR